MSLVMRKLWASQRILIWVKKSIVSTIIGLETSQERAESLCSEALEILAKLPYKTERLIKLSKFIILRDK